MSLFDKSFQQFDELINIGIPIENAKNIALENFPTDEKIAELERKCDTPENYRKLQKHTENLRLKQAELLVELNKLNIEIDLCEYSLGKK